MKSDKKGGRANAQDAARLDVVSLGLAVADVVVKPVGGIPERGDVAHVDYFGLHNGGDAANVAVNLAKMGFKAGLIAKVGEALGSAEDRAA